MNENKEIKEAVKELEEISQDYELRRVAELKEKYIRDERSAKRYYKEEGLRKGREKRIKEIIQTMLKKEIDKEQIASMTEISIEEIEEIQINIDSENK